MTFRTGKQNNLQPVSIQTLWFVVNNAVAIHSLASASGDIFKGQTHD